VREAPRDSRGSLASEKALIPSPRESGERSPHKARRERGARQSELAGPSPRGAGRGQTIAEVPATTSTSNTLRPRGGNRAACLRGFTALFAILAPAACTPISHASDDILPPGFVLETKIKNTGGRRGPIAIVIPRGGTPRIEGWRLPTRPRPTPTRPPVSTPRRPAPRVEPRVANFPASADRSCIADLEDWQVPFVPAGPLRGVATPVEITGPFGGIRLIARGGRPPQMDCALARALAETAPLFRDLGISGLSFSGAYNYRNVKGTNRLSGHAHGLAIDVHAFETRIGTIDVLRDYARDGGSWHGSSRRGTVDVCVGNSGDEKGRLLRTLACRLRDHAAFNLILTPDDNADHHNHLHIEAHPQRSRELLSGTPSTRYQGRRTRRR
jgi:hypothetical protein